MNILYDTVRRNVVFTLRTMPSALTVSPGDTDLVHIRDSDPPALLCCVQLSFHECTETIHVYWDLREAAVQLQQYRPWKYSSGSIFFASVWCYSSISVTVTETNCDNVFWSVESLILKTHFSSLMTLGRYHEIGHYKRVKKDASKHLGLFKFP